jgi:predicted glycosyltransferase
MKIIIGIGHPAHVHQFKNMIWNLEEDGHEVQIIAVDKDVTLHLLNTYKFEYKRIGKNYKNILYKTYGLIGTSYKTLKIARNFMPDILISRGLLPLCFASKLINKPHIMFTDTESAKLNDMLANPFADVICVPSCFRKDLGRKQIRYNGYKELAYLHPNYFKPENILEYLNLSKSDRLIIVRFISWSAAHDIKLRGIKKNLEFEFIKSLERYGHVFITSERKIDKKLEPYRITIPPEKIHSLLYYAQLYIGEGGTMATEAAILGTPAIHIEATASGKATGELCGNFLELRDKYDLLYFFADQNQALEKAIEILEDKNSKSEWQRKRERLLKDKIDVTAWMTDFIERYPESFYEYGEKRGSGK